MKKQLQVVNLLTTFNNQHGRIDNYNDNLQKVRRANVKRRLN